MSKTDDHKFATLTFHTVDGEKHEFKLKKREYRTRRQSKDIEKWVKENPTVDSQDLLIHIVSMEDEETAKILEDGDIENIEYDQMLKDFSAASEAAEVDDPEGESSASSTS